MNGLIFYVINSHRVLFSDRQRGSFNCFKLTNKTINYFALILKMKNLTQFEVRQ